MRIVPTDIGIDQQRRIEEGRSIRGLGEQAAVEALERYLRANPDAEALLLFEDTDIERRRVIVDERVSVIGTGVFLRELEAARLIQSADYILDEAAAQGRNVERQRQAIEASATRQRFREQLTAQSQDAARGEAYRRHVPGYDPPQQTESTPQRHEPGPNHEPELEDD